MQSPNIMAGKMVKVDAGWVSGMNSVRHPWLLQEGQYRRGLNVLNRGGIIQTRPGFAMKLILPDGNLQGFSHFQENKNNTKIDYLVFAVDGKVYAVPFPLAQPRNWDTFRLKNISFNPEAKFIHFCEAQKTVQTLADATVQIVPSYNVMMMQDGTSAAAFWDGVENRHLSEGAPTLETPRGTWMTFSGNRLWVARGELLIASDFLDPLKFVERTQGQGRGDFSFRKPITGLTSFMGEQRAESVIIFTDERSESINSGIKDRTKWATTTNFQSILFPSTGCVAGHSIVFQAGLMWWYSQGGLVASDTAASTMVTSQVNFKDAEMAFSKQYLHDDQSGICGVGFENFLLMSMPVGQNFNTETFVLDYSVVSELLSDKSPAWASIWTGIRPMQWVTALVGTKRRCFAASVDYTSLADGSHNHIWEAFAPAREDSFFELDADFTTTPYVQPIYCEFETRSLGDGQDLKAFSYAEADFIELSGDVNIRMDYRGRRGAFKKIGCKKILAPTEIASSGVRLTDDQVTDLGELRKQTRKFSSEDGDSNAGCPVCESEHSENIDKAFSVLLRWCGQAAVESVRLFLDAFPETSSGKFERDETQVCLVDETGQNRAFPREAGFIPPENLYASPGVHAWVSTQSYTKTLTCPEDSVTGTISVTAVSTFRSQISQDDANNKAALAAQQSAENQAAYLRGQYPCYWDAVKYYTRTCRGVLNGAVRAIVRQIDTRLHAPEVNLPPIRTLLAGDFWLDNATLQGKITARGNDGDRLLSWVKQNGFLSTIDGSDEPSSRRVTAIGQQSDGLLVVVGEFARYTNQIRSGIARLLPNGELDATRAYSSGFDTPPLCVCIDRLTDEAVVGGDFTNALGAPVTVPLIKINSFGDYASAFVPTGFTKVFAVKQDFSSGNFIVAGYDSAAGKVVVKKIDKHDGSDDATFTPFEQVIAEPAFISLAVQVDGAVLVSFTGLTDSPLSSPVFQFTGKTWTGGGSTMVFTSEIVVSVDGTDFAFSCSADGVTTVDGSHGRLNPAGTRIVWDNSTSWYGPTVLSSGTFGRTVNLLRLHPTGLVDLTFFPGDPGHLYPTAGARDLKVRGADGAVAAVGDFDLARICNPAQITTVKGFEGFSSSGATLGWYSRKISGTIYCVEFDEEDGTIFLGGDFEWTGVDVPNPKNFVVVREDGVAVDSCFSTTQGAGVRSTVSQADADSKAQTIAYNKAIAALPCT